MASYKDVIEAIRHSHSLREVLQRLKMPPSVLRRILRSPRFARQMEVEKLLTRAMVHYHASCQAGYALLNLAGLSMTDKVEAIRKSSMAVLSRALDMSVVPDAPKPTITAPKSNET